MPRDAGACSATRLAITHYPHALLLEYRVGWPGGAAQGRQAVQQQLRVREVRLVRLGPSSDARALADQVMRSFPRALDPASISKAQVVRLVAHLLQQHLATLQAAGPGDAATTTTTTTSATGASSSSGSSSTNGGGNVAAWQPPSGRADKQPPTQVQQVSAVSVAGSLVAAEGSGAATSSSSPCSSTPRTSSSGSSSGSSSPSSKGARAPLSLDELLGDLEAWGRLPGAEGTSRAPAPAAAPPAAAATTAAGAPALHPAPRAASNPYLMPAGFTASTAAAAGAHPAGAPGAGSAKNSTAAAAPDLLQSGGEHGELAAEESSVCLVLEPELEREGVDLNKVSNYELRLAKAEMEHGFQAHALRPGDPGFEYDRRVDFGEGSGGGGAGGGCAPAPANDWDEEGEGSGGSDEIF